MSENAFVLADTAPAAADPATPATPAAVTEATILPFPERIPEKYRVVKEDGTVDIEASGLKLAEGYDSLSKRLGGDDAPPKAPEEYAPEVPEGFDIEALKADPMYQDFLKGAHSRGINNKQLSYVIEEFAKRQTAAEPTIPGVIQDMDAFRGEMQKVWGEDPKAFDAGIQSGLKAIKAYLPGVTQEQLATIPNSPIVAQLLAAIGKDVGEDKRIAAAPIDGKDFDQQLQEIQSSAGYSDARHPEHKGLMAKQKELFERRYGKK